LTAGKGDGAVEVDGVAEDLLGRGGVEGPAHEVERSGPEIAAALQDQSAGVEGRAARVAVGRGAQKDTVISGNTQTAIAYNWAIEVGIPGALSVLEQHRLAGEEVDPAGTGAEAHRVGRIGARVAAQGQHSARGNAQRPAWVDLGVVGGGSDVVDQVDVCER